jgi:hypothetical protein
MLPMPDRDKRQIPSLRRSHAENSLATKLQDFYVKTSFLNMQLAQNNFLELLSYCLCVITVFYTYILH